MGQSRLKRRGVVGVASAGQQPTPRSRMSLLVSLALAAALGACATPRAPPFTTPAGEEPRPVSRPDAANIPPVLPAPPEESYLDLGPIIVNTPLRDSQTANILAIAAQRLRADALVEVSTGYAQAQPEERGTNPARPRRRFPDEDKVERPDSLGQPEPRNTRERSLYQAIRYISEMPPSAPIPEGIVAPMHMQFLESQSSLQQQLHLGFWLWRQDAISQEQYEALRTHLATHAVPELPLEAE